MASFPQVGLSDEMKKYPTDFHYLHCYAKSQRTSIQKTSSRAGLVRLSAHSFQLALFSATFYTNVQFAIKRRAAAGFMRHLF